jgi:hypothetical protein
MLLRQMARTPSAPHSRRRTRRTTSEGIRVSHGGGTDGRLHLLRDSFRVGLPYPDVCRKRVVVHKADAEMNKLASCKRLKLDYVSESYGVFVAIFTAYNADSSLRIESLYDSSHVAPAAFPNYIPNYIPYPTSRNAGSTFRKPAPKPCRLLVCKSLCSRGCLGPGQLAQKELFLGKPEGAQSAAIVQAVTCVLAGGVRQAELASPR